MAQPNELGQSDAKQTRLTRARLRPLVFISEPPKKKQIVRRVDRNERYSLVSRDEGFEILFVRQPCRPIDTESGMMYMYWGVISKTSGSDSMDVPRLTEFIGTDIIAQDHTGDRVLVCIEQVLTIRRAPVCSVAITFPNSDSPVAIRRRRSKSVPARRND